MLILHVVTSLIIYLYYMTIVRNKFYWQNEFSSKQSFAISKISDRLSRMKEY